MNRIVLLKCGHWFRENVPYLMAESSPRVCTAGGDGRIAGEHRAPEAFGGDWLYERTPQGLCLVPVVQYVSA